MIQLVPLFQIIAEYPFVARYQNAWPVRLLMLQFMGNTRNNMRAKGNINNNDQGPQDDSPDIARPSTTTPAANPDGDGEDEGPSDVNISDIDE